MSLGALAEPAGTEAALRKALDTMLAKQVHGGWGAAYTTDGMVMWGEYKPIPQDWITVQPPATPTTGATYLRAAVLLEEPRYKTAARRAVQALEALMTTAGGLPYEGPPEGRKRKVATYDDDVTTSALRFFLQWWKHTGKAEDLDRVHRAGQFILDTQYPIGGWPQRYPPTSGGYQRYITFNDNVMGNIVDALLLLHRETGEARYREAALKAGDCIIRLQGGDGEAIWAQQYDPDTLEPAWARKFEPPGYASSESRDVCDTLIALYLESGEARFLAPLPKAFHWYDTHRQEDGLWPRLHEPGTQRPVYGRRDRAVKVYDRAEATTGYSWEGNYFPRAAKAAYDRIQAMGRDAYREEQAKAAGKKPAGDTLQRRAQAAAASLSADGWWLEPPSDSQKEEYARYEAAPDALVINMGTFNANADRLMDALAAAD